MRQCEKIVIMVGILLLLIFAYSIYQYEISSYTIPYFSNPALFVNQSKDYYCGPASVQLILKYANSSILPTQNQLAVEMNCTPPNGTSSLNIHLPFDNASYGNLTDSYTIETNNAWYIYGIHAISDSTFSYSLTELKAQILENHPAILLIWSDINHAIDNNTNGHYVVAYGYDASGIYVADPWGGVPSYLNNTALDLRWDYVGYWMFIYDGNHL